MTIVFATKGMIGHTLEQVVVRMQGLHDAHIAVSKATANSVLFSPGDYIEPKGFPDLELTQLIMELNASKKKLVDAISRKLKEAGCCYQKAVSKFNEYLIAEGVSSAEFTLVFDTFSAHVRTESETARISSVSLKYTAESIDLWLSTTGSDADGYRIRIKKASGELLILKEEPLCI